MKAARYILRNITPLNVILLLFTAVVFAFIYPFINREFRVTISEERSTEGAVLTGKIPEGLPDISDYGVVGELNLFHPDRKPPPPIEEEETPQVQAPRQQVEFILHGTLISDDVTLAFVEDRVGRRSAKGSRKAVSIMRVGDTLSGYTLKSIEPHKIVMVRDQEELTIPVYNPGQPRQRQPAQKNRRKEQKKFYQRR